MKEFVGKDEIRSARKADIYGFLLSHHHSEVQKVGQYLQLRRHDSLFVKKGFPGFFRFSTEESGNPIDLLVDYFGYSFTDAVRALNGSTAPSGEYVSYAPTDLPVKVVANALPACGQPPYKRAYAYLTITRGISGDTINALISRGLIYQDVRGNVVFINRLQNYCEIRGSCSHVKYHQILKIDDSSPFWSFTVGKGTPTFFICESSIDAISLYELQKQQASLRPGSVFCSIGGAGKQRTISRLEEQKPGSLVLAVDNDTAGEECRRRNPDLPFLLPSLKDWNEDLIHHKKENLL